MIKKTASALSILVGLMGLAACGAHTSLKSSTHPSYTGKIYQKLAIEARERGNQENVQVEWTFKRKLDSPALETTPVSDLLPPNQNFTPEQKMETLKKNGIEGVLFVDLTDMQRIRVYHPPTSSNTQVKKNKDGSVTTQTTYSGDYTEDRTTQTHKLTLLDGADLKPVWVGSAVTEGNTTWTTAQDFYNALANAAVKRLQKDGLIKTPEK